MTKTAVSILHLITELSTGGAQQALARLLTGLDDGRYDPSVACFYNGEGSVAHQIRALGVPIIDLGMANKARLDALWRLFQLLRQVRPAILHTWMFHANVPGRVLGRLAGVPVIVSAERTMGQESHMRLRLNRLTAPWADQIMCVSQAVADYARAEIGLPPEKLVVVPNGIILDQFADLPAQSEARQSYGLPQKGQIIGAIGRPRPVKGYDVLLDAFARLASDHPDAHLLFVGDGPDRATLMAQAAGLGLADRTTFLRDQTPVTPLLPALNVLVLPSRHEGMPNVALEAMAARLPVVATAVGGTPEVVVDSETGLLVPPEDPFALAEALSALLRDEKWAARMGQAGYARVAKHFTLTRMVQQVEALYDAELARKSAKPFT